MFRRLGLMLLVLGFAAASGVPPVLAATAEPGKAATARTRAGKPVILEFRYVDVAEFLRNLAKAYHQTVIIDESVKHAGGMSIHLEGVYTFEEILGTIAKLKKLTVNHEGKVWVVTGTPESK